MARVSTATTEFENIFKNWEKQVHAKIYSRVPYIQYSIWKDLFINSECHSCEEDIDHLDINISSTRVIIKCPHCKYTMFDVDRKNYLADQVVKYVEKRKDMAIRDADKEQIREYFEKYTHDAYAQGGIASKSWVSTSACDTTASTVRDAMAWHGSNPCAEIVLPMTSITAPSIPPTSTTQNNKISGGNNMINVNSMFKGFQFGAVKGDNFKLSPMGLAFKTRDGYSVYNVTNDEVTDVTGMTFDMDGMIFAMPVAHSKIAANDIILHNNNAVVVKEVKEKSIVVVFPGLSEIKEIMPTKNMFGFNFYTKIKPLIDLGSTATADDENPFGNLMPLMLMSQGSNGSQGGMNPMMMMALMGDKLGDGAGMSKEMMMAMAFSGQGGQGNDMMMALMMSKML